MQGQFGKVQGDAGIVKVGPAQAGIINRWVVQPTGKNPDGSARLTFKCQFSWYSEALMTVKMRKRVIVTMKTRYGTENVDIVKWDDERLEGGVLTLENIMSFESRVISK